MPTHMDQARWLQDMADYYDEQAMLARRAAAGDPEVEMGPARGLAYPVYADDYLDSIGPGNRYRIKEYDDE